MTIRRNSNADTAVQYLIWALEEIDKDRNQEAARHVRMALEALREGAPPSVTTDEHATSPTSKC